MYVITGATGHTGNVAAKELLAKGLEVRAIGRSEDRLQALKTAGAEPWVCDMTNAVKLTEAFRGAKAVYVMIPPDMTSNDFRAHQDRVTEAVRSALEAAGVKYAVALRRNSRSFWRTEEARIPSNMYVHPCSPAS